MTSQNATMTRRDHIASMTGGTHVDRHRIVHVLADADRAACGRPTDTSDLTWYDRRAMCSTCIEHVLLAKKRIRQERRRTALRDLATRLRLR